MKLSRAGLNCAAAVLAFAAAFDAAAGEGSDGSRILHFGLLGTGFRPARRAMACRGKAWLFIMVRAWPICQLFCRNRKPTLHPRKGGTRKT